MANYHRRVPAPSAERYYAVPQSPPNRSAGPSRQPSINQAMPMPMPQQHPSTSNYSAYSQGGYSQGGYSQSGHSQSGHSQGGYRDRGYRREEDGGETTHNVATGRIGGGYGPYSYQPDVNASHYSSSRFSNAPSEVSVVTTREKAGTAPLTAPQTTNTVPPYMWDTKDPDLDDALHNPDPIRDAALDRSFTIFSARGWMNASALIILVAALLLLFAGYPIIIYTREPKTNGPGFNLGGINSSGQVPDLKIPSLIDRDTPQDAYTRVGTDGNTYNLVFSDEFNLDGRTFWPGDDPYWEAVDLNYWPTGDLEWYDPQAIVTEGGKLVITIDEVLTHDLNWRSGMLQSWNKLCFTTGYVEVSVSMPGSPRAAGLWPGVWTMGNLGRAGFGATNEGMWPYSYDSCDVGTFPNQTDHSGNPVEAQTGGNGGSPLSFLPGQRLSACTCPGSDHPGPSYKVGRGVPEIDIIETQIDTRTWTGEVSQSFQVAPYNYKYEFDNSTDATIVHNPNSFINSYKGGEYQQAVSVVTPISGEHYGGNGYATYGYEWWSNPNNRDEGYITWICEGQQTWTATSKTIGPDPISQVSQRLISEEPMYIILNLGMSPSFQHPDLKNLKFPSKMYIDYVRVYQRPGVKDGLTCDPPNRPTADYINEHINAYMNPNYTTWDQAGYTFPRNSLYDSC